MTLDEKLQYIEGFVHKEWLSEALQSFHELPEYEIYGNVEKNGDHIFQKYGRGNCKSKIDRPYERILVYEILLDEFQKADAAKFHAIHKGTAFYFLAWLYFDIKDFSKGLHYADAAIAEDFEHGRGIESVATQFYTLRQSNEFSERTTDRIVRNLDTQLIRYNALEYVVTEMNRATFVEYFVAVILNDPDRTKRSIISALYRYILEFSELYKLLTVRTINGGSTLPFLTHLFSGGIIFESILKLHYSGKTLGDILKNNPDFKIELNPENETIATSASNLTEIISNVTSNPPSGFIGSVNITAKLRNTTGHNLVWNDIFTDPENFKRLFEIQLDSIIYLISKKYLI